METWEKSKSLISLDYNKPQTSFFCRLPVLRSEEHIKGKKNTQINVLHVMMNISAYKCE